MPDAPMLGSSASKKVKLDESAFAARVRPEPFLLGNAPPNCTIPPVSVSHTWPGTAARIARVRELEKRLVSE